jgi:Nucleotidyl transferase AbiEii toxin, Type IV TA system
MNDEPQSARDYDDRTSAAVKSVLVEIGQTLGSFRGKFAVIGGAVPWLLLEDSEMRHVGTLDIDLSLDAQALAAGEEYVALVDALHEQGYAPRDTLKYFQMVRTVQPKDDGPPIDVIVEFLRPYDAVLEKNRPPLTTEFATQRASGAELAIHFHELVAIEGDMPKGGTNKVMIAVASIPALLAMKGFALDGRYKQKDAYDVYYSIRNYPGGIDALAGFSHVVAKFDDPDGYGPTCVRNFVEGSDILDGRTPDEWQQDAFGQVDAWARAMGLR